MQTTTHETDAPSLVDRLGAALAAVPAPSTPAEANLRNVAARLHKLLAGSMPAPAPTGDADPLNQDYPELYEDDATFDAGVQAAMDDPAPGIPQEEAMRRVFAAIEQAATDRPAARRAPRPAGGK